VFKLVWIDAPTWRFVVAYIALGWVAVAAVPQLAVAIGVGGLTLFGLGGVLYTVGAVIYAVRRPDPVPAVFGYHEVFHALVIVAAALQYAVIAFWVVPH
jgi:hemolysin III